MGPATLGGVGEWETLGVEGPGEGHPGQDGLPEETLELGDDLQGPDKAPRHVRCRVGLHHWEAHRTEDGKTYRTCTICGEDEFQPPLFMGVDPHHR